MRDGAIPNSGGETWASVVSACFKGKRGLPGTWTLDDLLVQRRGKHSHLKRPQLDIAQIRKWARAYYTRTRKWPSPHSGAIDGTDGESWNAVSHALSDGIRGIKHKTTLGRVVNALKVQEFGPILMLGDIALWARAFYRRHGTWPERYSGRIPDAPGETWLKIDNALRHQLRGIKRSTSLDRFASQLAVPRRFA